MTTSNNADVSLPCRLCGGGTHPAFRHIVMRRYSAQYQICSSCDFISAQPADWLDDAYSSAIACTDTGAVLRNESLAHLMTSFAWLAGLSHVRGLDVGGGHGLLVRMLRDRGLDFYWMDSHATNIFARGFEADNGPYAWIAMVEVFEHLTSPLQQLKSLVERHNPRCILFTTELRPTHIPSLEWPYWSFETGQHIGFASAKSLDVLATSLRYRLLSRGPLHLLYTEPRHAVALHIAASKLRHLVLALLSRRKRSLTQTDHVALVKILRSLE